MSSSVLQHKIPYSILYLDVDLFSLLSKIFGSLRFVHNHNPHKTKLDFRSLKGIYFCYSRTQKCYKYFCPSIDRYILSTDVTFFESKLHISFCIIGWLWLPIPLGGLLNSGESTSENMTDKNTLRFHNPIQVYTRWIAPIHVPPPASVSSLAQASNETVTAQLHGNSTTYDIQI